MPTKTLLSGLGLLLLPRPAAWATGREMAGLADGLMLMAAGAVLLTVIFIAFTSTLGFYIARRNQNSVLKSMLIGVTTGLGLFIAAGIALYLIFFVPAQIDGRQQRRQQEDVKQWLAPLAVLKPGHVRAMLTQLVADMPDPSVYKTRLANEVGQALRQFDGQALTADDVSALEDYLAATAAERLNSVELHGDIVWAQYFFAVDAALRACHEEKNCQLGYIKSVLYSCSNHFDPCTLDCASINHLRGLLQTAGSAEYNTLYSFNNLAQKIALRNISVGNIPDSIEQLLLVLSLTPDLLAYDRINQELVEPLRARNKRLSIEDKATLDQFMAKTTAINQQWFKKNMPSSYQYQPSNSLVNLQGAYAWANHRLNVNAALSDCADTGCMLGYREALLGYCKTHIDACRQQLTMAAVNRLDTFFASSPIQNKREVHEELQALASKLMTTGQ